MSGRTLNRLIGGLVALIVVGVPTIAIIYYSDRHVDAGPSIIDRQLAAAEEVVRVDPNKLSSRIALAVAYAADDQPAKAIEQYGVVLGVDSLNRVALLGRGDAYRAEGNLDAAAADYQALVDEANDDEMAVVDRMLEAAYYGLGVIAHEQGRPRDAATHLADALMITRTDADALNLLGAVLVELGDHVAAIDALRDAVALVPTGWCEPYAHMADAYTGLADSDGSAYASGMVALCEGRVADAEQALAPLTGGTHGRDALIGLGLAAEARGDVAAAAAAYQRVYDADPTDFAATSGLNRVSGQAVTNNQPAPTGTQGPQ